MKTMNKYHGIGLGMGMLEFANLDKKNYGHNGSIDDFASLLQYFPEEKLSIAVTSNGVIYPIDNLIYCALSSYFASPFAMPNFNYLALQPALLSLYAGQYTSVQIPLKIAVTINENKLFGQVKGQPVFPLEATATNIFNF